MSPPALAYQPHNNSQYMHSHNILHVHTITQQSLSHTQLCNCQTLNCGQAYHDCTHTHIHRKYTNSMNTKTQIWYRTTQTLTYRTEHKHISDNIIPSIKPHIQHTHTHTQKTLGNAHNQCTHNGISQSQKQSTTHVIDSIRINSTSN